MSILFSSYVFLFVIHAIQGKFSVVFCEWSAQCLALPASHSRPIHEFCLWHNGCFLFLNLLVLKYFLAYLVSSVKSTNVLVWKDSPKKLVWVSLESLFHVVRVTNDSGYINLGFHFYYFCLTDEYLSRFRVGHLGIILNYFNFLCPAFRV